MKAGRLKETISASVSPLEKVVDEDGDLGDGDLPEELESEGLVRIGAEEDGDFIRKLVDPKLPSKREVELHELRGHVEYRNWCSVCVRCKGKQLDHQRQGKRNVNFQNTGGITVFLGIRWVISGLFWWVGNVVPRAGWPPQFQ